MPNGAARAGLKEDITARLLTTFKSLISEGALILGSRLPPERELAEKFQVSRSSLRQALKSLEIMGVISQRVGDGTYVNDAASSLLGQPLEFLILLNKISFHELMEARLIVEPELAAQAAIRADRKDLTALRRELQAMKDSKKDRNLTGKHDLEFHKAIFEAAGNRVCSMMFTVIHQSLHNVIDLIWHLAPVNHALLFHQKIYDAIRQADPAEARMQMTNHLRDVQGVLARANDEKQNSHLHNRITELATQSAPRARRKS